MSFTEKYVQEAAQILAQVDQAKIESLVRELARVREQGGRLFLLGVGGSAANASHAVNDFRKLVGLEAYTPTDNVSELTARTNDEGWGSVFRAWLEGSRLQKKDAVLVLSVGGGSVEKNISANLVQALDFAKKTGAVILGIVGRDGGHTAKTAKACVVIPTVNPENVTPHTEAMQSVICHLLVSHPELKRHPTKWESSK